jgi:hypothetical protein
MCYVIFYGKERNFKNDFEHHRYAIVKNRVLEAVKSFLKLHSELKCYPLCESGCSPTEATRLRFDQEKSRLHLIHGDSSSHRGRAGGRSAITN